uniref:C2H2-type domain-containing protein n=1 Tax=Scylla olivacea TaxID=85551 RepID=A0A0P4W6I8_SCYOL
MSEAEEERKEVLLPFPEVYIKEEVKTEAQDSEEDYEERMCLEEDHAERSVVGNSYGEDYAALQDDEFGQLQDIEGLRGEDGEIHCEQTQDDLRCGVCQREYSSPTSLKAHLSKKHRLAIGPCFTCHLCGAIAQTRATLRRHLLRTHGQSSLKEHQMLKKCQHCGEGHVTLMALNAHIAEAHAELLAQYQQCPHCPGLFRGRPSLLRHISRRHPDADPPCLDRDQCQECQRNFPTRTALRLHLKNHHPEALIHRCQSCSATFKYSSMLRRHVKNVHEKQRQQKEQQLKEERYKCCKCPREYRSKTFLEKHLALVHLAPKQPRVYSCAMCSATFNSRSRRARHTRMVHWDKSRPRCSECNQCFDTTEELNAHRQKHKMKCAVCDKTFLRRDSLREHLLIHSGPKLPCPFCPKKFTQNSNLKRHIRVHTGEKPYKCSFCSKRFGDKSACNSHMRVHTGAERCSCPECGASFSKRQKLNYHMRKHTGEGLLHCPLCTRSATNSYSHKKHLETHQTVLGRLLQGSRVLGQTEDCQSLALRTLHNLAWVSARGRAHDQISSLHPSRITSPVVEDKVERCEGETQQVFSSDNEKDKKNDSEDSGDVRTPIEHVEVTVKMESPEELVEPVHSSSKSEGKNLTLRQFRKLTRKVDVLTDPLNDKDHQHIEKIQKYDGIKTEVLSYIMNLRCTQFNEAVEKCKLETAIKVEKDSVHSQNRSNLWKNKENNTDETECAPNLKELETTLSMTNKRDDIDIKTSADDNTLNVAWEQMKECSYTLAEEPLTVLARLWQLIVEPKEGQQHCEEITHFSRLLVKEEHLQAEANKDTSSSVLNPSVQSEPEKQTNTVWIKQESSDLVMDSEVSESGD